MKRSLAKNLDTDDEFDEEIVLGPDSDTSEASSLAGESSEEDDQSGDEHLVALEERRIKVIRKKQLPVIEGDYLSDSSDDETHNTIGNVPMEWYKDYPHIGYDVNGRKIMKPAQGDDLDKFLSSMDDKNAWRSVYDKLEGKDIVLNKEELEMLKRIQQHQFPETQFDPYEPSVDWFSSKTEIMPLSAAPEPKRRFVPSKMEASKIMKLARAIRAGIIVPGRKKSANEKSRLYDIWENAEGIDRPNHIPAPKLALPEHLESYNPPPEYILDEKEEKEWRGLDAEDRPHSFLPKIHSALRAVAAYPRFIQERFERCLDLYLAPRAIKQKLDIDPESLIPKLPSPKDLRPFPTKQSITYTGHTGRVRSICTDPTGQWIASGSDDLTVKVWEISSGRCLSTILVKDAIMSVTWNPNKTMSLLAIAHGSQISLIDPGVGHAKIVETTTEIMTETIERIEKTKSGVSWEKPSGMEKEQGYYLHLIFPKSMTSVVWHRKGDYFATVSPDSNSTAVQIHQLSKATSQSPFKKSIGQVQKVIFHPSRPFLFVATQQSVRVYNLVKQEMIRKLLPGAKWISSIDIHPGGDNVIIGTYDKRIHWFDMDLSSKPYKTLRYHHAAVRQVAFHPRYPLFASSSDDGSVLLFHGMVYNDLMQNPLIVPVKTLKGHEKVSSLGVLDCVWHPTQPWIFSSGADKTIKLFI